MLAIASLLLLVAPIYSQVCSINTYTDVNQCYDCGTTQRTYIAPSQLPSGFNGAKQVTFGFWNKNTINMGCISSWEMLFKVSWDGSNSARKPAIYRRSSGTTQYFYTGFGYSTANNYTELVVPMVYGNWYYIVVATDFYLNRVYTYIYDPTKVTTQLTDGVVWSSYLILHTTAQYLYTGTDYLLFGSDYTTHNLGSSSCVSFPSVIVGQAISDYSEITMMAYTLAVVPSFTKDFFGTPVMRSSLEYDTPNKNLIDTIAEFPYSYDYGTTDGTAKTNLSSVWTVSGVYQTIQLNDPKQILIMAPPSTPSPRNFSFIDSWGYLSFGVRIVFKMTSMSYSSSCRHWLLRRVQTGTGAVRFGLGIKSDGTVAINLGGKLATTTTQGFVTENEWTTLKVGCFSRGFTNKILCIVLNSDGLSQAREEVWITYTGASPYSTDATSDKLLFGGSSCGASKLYTLQINHGFVPEILQSCRWNCAQTLPSSGFCSMVSYWSNSNCATNAAKIPTRTECIKCPAGCTKCRITDFNVMTLVCSECATGLTLSSKKMCQCPYGKYYDPLTSSCKAQIVVYAYLALVPDTTYQFKVTFSTTIPDLQMITNVIQATIINGDYTGNSPTITVVDYEYLLIDFNPTSAVEDGTTLWVSGLTSYNQLLYNPYFIQPETLSYVFGLVPAYSSTVAIPPAPYVPPLEYGPRQLTIVMSVLNIVFALMGSSAMLLIKVLSDIFLFKFINVGFPQNFIDFSAQYIGNGFFIPNPFGNIEKDSSLIPVSSTGQFQPWVISTVYLQNAGSVLTKELICAGMIILGWLAYFAASPSFRFKEHMRKAAHIFYWNVSLCVLFGDFPELMIYTILQITEGTNATTYQRMSIAAMSFMLAIYAIFYARTIYLLNFKKRKQHTYPTANEKTHSEVAANKPSGNTLKKDEDEQSPKKLQKKSKTENQVREQEPLPIPLNMCIIALDIYQDSFFSRNFVLVLQVHNFLLALVISLIQVSGIVQSLYFVLLHSLLLVYLPTFRPFKNSLQYIIMGMNCIGQLILSVIAALLGSNDRYPSISDSTKTAIGKVMIGIELVLLIGSSLLAIIIIIKKIKSFFPQQKVSDSKVIKMKKFEKEFGHDTSRTGLIKSEKPPGKVRKNSQ